MGRQKKEVKVEVEEVIEVGPTGVSVVETNTDIDLNDPRTRSDR